MRVFTMTANTKMQMAEKTRRIGKMKQSRDLQRFQKSVSSIFPHQESMK
jgi:hypothetical protein